MPLSIISTCISSIYWPGGNSEVRAGQEMDGYRQDTADARWNVIHVPTAWKNAFPRQRRISLQELKSITAAWLHFCLFHFDPRCHCGRQDLRGLSGPLFFFLHRDYLSSPFSTALPHTMYNLRHLLTIVLSAFQEMSYFDQTRAGKLFQKMASHKELERAVWLG